MRKDLISRLGFEGISSRVLDAIEAVPRHKFVPEDEEELAYYDTPLSIGDGQTISAPSMVAVMCDVLDIREGMKVLEVGTGLGYHSAVMSLLAKPGKIYTVERFADLAERARSILGELGYDNVEVFVSDGSEGLAQFAPYDRISVACAAPKVPEPLIEQLKENGKMVIPVGKYTQELVLVEKIEGKVRMHDRGGVAFVPMVGKYGFKERGRYI
nr:protein-L-isoaspartate O-methyltransferase [Methanocella sp. CWC-04]